MVTSFVNKHNLICYEKNDIFLLSLLLKSHVFRLIIKKNKAILYREWMSSTL